MFCLVGSLCRCLVGQKSYFMAIDGLGGDGGCSGEGGGDNGVVDVKNPKES